MGNPISLFIFTTILIISIKPITEAEIYSDNFKYDIYGVTRGSNDDKIIHSLSMYNYEESFKLLSETLKEDSTQNIYIFYYSVIAMELDKQDIAQKYLKN